MKNPTLFQGEDNYKIAKYFVEILKSSSLESQVKFLINLAICIFKWNWFNFLQMNGNALFHSEMITIFLGERCCQWTSWKYKSCKCKLNTRLLSRLLIWALLLISRKIKNYYIEYFHLKLKWCDFFLFHISTLLVKLK